MSPLLKKLPAVLEQDLTAVCRLALQKHSGERFYSVALYTSGEYSYVVDSLCTAEGLLPRAREYLEKEYYKKEWGTIEVAMRELKWSPADHPHHAEHGEKLAATQALIDEIWADHDGYDDPEFMAVCEAIHGAFVEVLAKVRDGGLFAEEGIVYNVLMGDQSDEERLLNAEAINHPQVTAAFAQELEIDERRLEELRAGRRSE